MYDTDDDYLYNFIKYVVDHPDEDWYKLTGTGIEDIDKKSIIKDLQYYDNISQLVDKFYDIIS